MCPLTPGHFRNSSFFHHVVPCGRSHFSFIVTFHCHWMTLAYSSCGCWTRVIASSDPYAKSCGPISSMSPVAMASFLSGVSPGWHRWVTGHPGSELGELSQTFLRSTSLCTPTSVSSRCSRPALLRVRCVPLLPRCPLMLGTRSTFPCAVATWTSLGSGDVTLSERNSCTVGKAGRSGAPGSP